MLGNPLALGIIDFETERNRLRGQRCSSCHRALQVFCKQTASGNIGKSNTQYSIHDRQVLCALF